MTRKLFLKVLAFISLFSLSYIMLHSKNLTWPYNSPRKITASSQILTQAKSQSVEVKEVKKKFLLVMFTSFKDSVEHDHHSFVHHFVIKSWKELSVEFKQVAFTTNVNSNLSREAAVSGWDVVQLNRSLPSGAPYFRDMYKYAFANYHSVFYSFINGDILFDDSLMKTLKVVKENLQKYNNNVLIVGQRTNYLYDNYNDSKTLEKNNLRNLAKKGSLFWTCAEDFFIYTPPPDNKFAWDLIVDVVVGRVAYDNYAMSMANTFGVNTIDATRTLLALHVSHPKILQTGSENKDGNINKRLIGKFNYNSGLTTNSIYRTGYIRSNIVILKR